MTVRSFIAYIAIFTILAYILPYLIDAIKLIIYLILIGIIILCTIAVLDKPIDKLQLYISKRNRIKYLKEFNRKVIPSSVVIASKYTMYIQKIVYDKEINDYIIYLNSTKYEPITIPKQELFDLCITK